MATYAEHYGPTPVPDSVYEGWATTNVQLVCGVKSPTPTKLVVVDCDGPEAAEVWGRMLKHHGTKLGDSWTAVTGGGGLHYYFTLPDGVGSCASGLVWGCWDSWGDGVRGAWVKHKEVRVLADNALVVAPPSVHVDTGRRYRFSEGRSPNEVRLPEPAPMWLLALPRLGAPTFPHERPVRVEAPLKPSVRPSDRFYDRNEVLAAIDDKIALAVRLGLRVARRPNASGWASVFAAGREEKHPSGCLQAESGVYQDRASGLTCSFFDLLVLLGAFPSWRDARDWCGQQYLPAGNPSVRAAQNRPRFNE